jgi:RNA binding exosome subunit
LLALAASEGFQVYQTDIIQAFLHGKLSDVDIYIKPPARFPAPPNTTLKLKKAIYGLHQAPIKFKQELIQWFQEQQYTPANEAKTIWIKRVDDKLLIHALYADDFLHFTNSSSLYQQFQKAFRSKFDIKTGHVQLYLGNQITVDQTKLSVQINQSQYIDDLLQRFEMTNCNPVSTPMIQRLSEK